MTSATRDPQTALPPELLAQIKSIELRARRLATQMFAGEYESAFKGRGMRFEQVREYQPGDDVRHIDWNVTARMRAPYIKEFREEREITVMLLVDVSASTAFGSRQRTKAQVLAEVAAILAYTAIRSLDRVGLLLFSDQVEQMVFPKKGRAHVWRVMREIMRDRPPTGGTHIASALLRLGQITHQPCVVFLLSDFMDTSYADALATAARRHDITAMRIDDPLEQELPACGLVQLRDSESGNLLLVDSSHPPVRRQLAAAWAACQATRDAACLAAGVPQVRFSTRSSPVAPLLQYFRSQGKRRQR
jgi:uncharacterized protein (DUF58 family)